MLFAITAILFVGCSSDDDDAADISDVVEAIAAMPQCRSWVDAPVTSELIEKGCRDGTTIMGTGSKPCQDGSTIFWNDVGWGYLGEAMRLHPDDQTNRAPPPEEYWQRCLGLP